MPSYLDIATFSKNMNGEFEKRRMWPIGVA
jgi:hypothetical protein